MRIALLITGVGLRNPSGVVFVADDIAQIVLDWSMMAQVPAARHVHLRGSATDIVRRGADGLWRLAAQGVPNLWAIYGDLIAANAWLGRDAEAKSALADLLKLMPNMTAQAYLAAAATYSDNTIFTQQIGRMVEGMHKGGLPEGEAKTN
jgi:hypothetical protein